MSNMIRISKEEYDVLMEQKHNCIFCKKNMFFNCERVEEIYNSREQLKKQLAKKDNIIATLEAGVNVRQRDIEELGDEIEKLKEEVKWRQDGIEELENEIDKKNKEIEELKATIKRQNQQLTEKELYEKKSKETAPTGVPAIDATVDRLIKLEAKFEAQESPYFF